MVGGIWLAEGGSIAGVGFDDASETDEAGGLGTVRAPNCGCDSDIVIQQV